MLLSRLTVRIIAVLLVAIALASGMPSEAAPPAVTDGGSGTLYEAFQNPPSAAKPFTRWWWNGNQVAEDQLLHELDVMRAAGIGVLTTEQ